MATQKTPLPDLAGGLNKDKPAHRLEANELAEANNIVYRDAIWTKRLGYTHPYTAVTGTYDVVELCDFVRRDGTTYFFAGTTDGIELQSGGGWTNKLNLGTTRATTDKWFFAEFTNAIFATNGIDNIYTATTGSFSAISWDTSTDVGGETGISVTKAQAICTLNNRLIMLNTTDSVDGEVGNRIRYTQVNDNNRSETNDYIDLDASGSPIKSGGVLLNNLIAVYQEDMVTLVQNQGNPVLAPKLRFNPGIIAPKAWTFIPGGGHFYVSQTGFHMFAGGYPQAVGETKVTSYFFSQLDTTYQDNVYCYTDWFYREIHILYPDSNATAGRPNRELIYNWQYNVWSEADLEAWCGFYKYREQTSKVIYLGADSGIVRQVGGTTDNGTAISTKLRTKALSNAPAQDSLAPDYIQVNRVKTDALPTTATVKVGKADYGRETPTFTEATVTATDGYAPYADIDPTSTRYASIEVTGFTTLSEMTMEWTPGGDE